MKNWLIAAAVTEAARKLIEVTGGTIEILSEDVYSANGQRERPALKLITLSDGLYHGVVRNNGDGYVSWTLSRTDSGYQGNGEGICYWNGDPIALVIYHWDGNNPDDVELEWRKKMFEGEGEEDEAQPYE